MSWENAESMEGMEHVEAPIVVKVMTAEICLKLLADIVEKFGGDHVYQRLCPAESENAEGGCYNWDRDLGCPSCLVGQVMFAWGIPGEFLSGHHEVSSGVLVNAINRDATLPFTVGTLADQILFDVQDSQDCGKPWGTALAKGIQVYLKHKDRLS